MIRLDIPQRGVIELQHAVFDVNGTLAVDGIPIPGVVDRLHMLAEQLSLHALTAGTHGNIAELERTFGFPFHIIATGEEKLRLVEQLRTSRCDCFRQWQERCLYATCSCYRRCNTCWRGSSD